MLKYKPHKYFLIIIFLFGLAPLESEKRGKIIYGVLFKSILSRILPLCFVLINLSQFSFLLKMVDATMEGLIYLILFYGYFVIVVSSNIVANLQCLRKHSAYVDIIRHIQKVECLFMIQFSKIIDYRTSKFKVKPFIIFSILICATFTSYCINEWQFDKSTLLRTVVTTLEIISSFVCLHPILYLDILGLLIHELSDTLKKPEKLLVPSDDILEKCKTLKKLKSIHIELWILVQKINSYFGWNFLFLLMKFFVDITYNLYCFFIEFQDIGWKSFSHFGMEHFSYF